MHIASCHSLVKIGSAGLLIAVGLVFPACSKNTSPPEPSSQRPAPSGALAPGESGKTTAIGRAVDSARSIAATQITAGQLQKLYAPQLKTLQASLPLIQDGTASNPSLPSGDAAAAFQELRALVPELAEMLDALRNYDQDGLTDIAGKIQTGFAKASELYAKLTGRSLASPRP